MIYNKKECIKKFNKKHPSSANYYLLLELQAKKYADLNDEIIK